MELSRDLGRKSFLLVIVTFFVSFLIFYVTFYQNSTPTSTVSVQVKSCDIFSSPPLVGNRRPQILQAGRVKLVDYTTFPDEEKIECVKHHAAGKDTRICVMPVNKDMISNQLRTQQGWEPHITKTFRGALEQCPDCQVLDFGANLGVYGLIGAGAGRKVFAVEPMTENLMYLVKSVRVNNFQSSMKIISNTLSDVYEELEFWRPYRNAGGSIARRVGDPAPDKRLYDGPFDRIASVQIDNLLEVIDFNKAVMKIDIEGYEPRAFSGASRFFDQMDIRFIFMEWSNKGTDPQALSMAQSLARRGYTAHDPNMNSLGEPTPDNVKKWGFDIVWKKNV